MEQLYELVRTCSGAWQPHQSRAAWRRFLGSGFMNFSPAREGAATRARDDEAAHEMAVTARGVAKAAEILSASSPWSPPMCLTSAAASRQRAQGLLRASHHPTAKADLATCFCRAVLGFLLLQGGSSPHFVTPQNWLFLGTYRALRQRLLWTIQLGVVVVATWDRAVRDDQRWQKSVNVDHSRHVQRARQGS